MNTSLSPAQAVLPLSPACLGCPAVHPTAGGATGAPEPGQIVSWLAGCVHEPLVSGGLTGTAQLGEAVPWGVASVKVAETGDPQPCAEAGDSQKGRAFSELEQEGGETRGRHTGTASTPPPSPASSVCMTFRRNGKLTRRQRKQYAKQSGARTLCDRSEFGVRRPRKTLQGQVFLKALCRLEWPPCRRRVGDSCCLRYPAPFYNPRSLKAHLSPAHVASTVPVNMGQTALPRLPGSGQVPVRVG